MRSANRRTADLTFPLPPNPSPNTDSRAQARAAGRRPAGTWFRHQFASQIDAGLAQKNTFSMNFQKRRQGGLFPNTRLWEQGPGEEPTPGGFGGPSAGDRGRGKSPPLFLGRGASPGSIFSNPTGSPVPRLRHDAVLRTHFSGPNQAHDFRAASAFLYPTSAAMSDHVLP
jgi:hypothetical protein